jgi:hypothetical protein
MSRWPNSLDKLQIFRAVLGSQEKWEYRVPISAVLQYKSPPPKFCHFDFLLLLFLPDIPWSESFSSLCPLSFLTPLYSIFMLLLYYSGKHHVCAVVLTQPLTQGGDRYYPYFREEETETQRNQMAWAGHISNWEPETKSFAFYRSQTFILLAWSSDSFTPLAIFQYGYECAFVQGKVRARCLKSSWT